MSDGKEGVFGSKRKKENRELKDLTGLACQKALCELALSVVFVNGMQNRVPPIIG